MKYLYLENITFLNVYYQITVTFFMDYILFTHHFNISLKSPWDF